MSSGHIVVQSSEWSSVRHWIRDGVRWCSIISYLHSASYSAINTQATAAKQYANSHNLQIKQSEHAS